MLRLPSARPFPGRRTVEKDIMNETNETIRKNNLFFRQLLFLAVLILIGAVVLGKLKFLVGSFLGAVTLYIVCRPWLLKLTERRRWRPWIASLLIVSAVSVVLGGLIFGVFRIVSSELINLDFGYLISSLDDIVDRLNRQLPFDLISPGYLSELSAYLAKAAGSVINTTYSFVINILFMIVILYFMLANSRRMERKLGRYNPFKGESRLQINNEVAGIIYSNAVGIPLIMLGQGLTAALIYWLFGVPHAAFWAFMTAVAGLIPVVGSAIVSVPLGIWFMIQGNVWQGILLMACGVLVIANVDNLLRIVLNKRMTDTHPLIVIFGVLMGIPLFGFWGIIFGPLLISLFLLLVKLYYIEFRLMTPAEIDEELSVGQSRRHGRKWGRPRRGGDRMA